MTNVLTAHRPITPHRSPAPRLSAKEDLLTIAFTCWLIIGLFVDGWAHNNDKPETFFTPWHGLLYSGFVATALWVVSRYQRHGRAPAGYGLGLVGVAGFALGGGVDMVWHMIFGVEVDLEALLSPSHLVLFASGLLLVSSPLRAAWSDPDPARHAPSLRAFLPPLISITLVTASVSFFMMVFSPFLSSAATRAPYRFIETHTTPEIGSWLAEEVQLGGFASILLTTVVLMAPTLLLLRRWRLPFGALTVLFTTVVGLVSATEGFDMGEAAIAGVADGLAGDVLVRALQRRSVTTVTTIRIVGAAVPAVLWLAYFGLLAVFSSVGWTVELWAGITCMAALAGYGLALLMVPPSVPEGAVPPPVPEGAVPPSVREGAVPPSVPEGA